MKSTNSEQPLVSVIIPTYNHAHFLSHTLQSVVSQDYANFEVIVIDNHSQDNTDEVVQRFAESRVTLLKIHNNGVIASSRNMGIQAAQGEWIAFLDSDDLWLSNKLQICFEHINDKTDIIYHDLRIIREKPSLFQSKTIKSRQLNAPVLVDLLVNGNTISTSSVVVRKRLLDQIGGINESPAIIAAEDYNTWLRIAQITDGFCHIPKSLGYYMLHSQGISRKDMSIPARCASASFVHLLSDKQQRCLESCLKYTKGRYAFVSQDYSVARENLLFSACHGKPMIKLKSAWMLIEMLIKF